MRLYHLATILQPSLGALALKAAAVLQAKGSLQAVLIIGGQNQTVQALQKRLGDGPEVVHFHSDSWYKRHWLEVPAGGRPSTTYIGESVLTFVCCVCSPA